MGAVPIEILQLILTQTQNQQVTTDLTFHFLLDKNVRKGESQTAIREKNPDGLRESVVTER